MALHITKVAVGCDDADVLRDRMAGREENGTAPIWTRYRPTRFAEVLDGGSIYWIIKHRLVARQTILGFEETEDGRWLIRLDVRVVPVMARPKRAHQGWRYLADGDRPADLSEDGGDLGDMPRGLMDELSALALI